MFLIAPNSIIYENNKITHRKRFEFKPLGIKHLSLLRIAELRLTKTHSHFAINAKNKFGIEVELFIKRRFVMDVLGCFSCYSGKYRITPWSP